MNVAVNGRVFSVDEPSGAGQAGINLVQSLSNQDISLTVYGHKEAESRFESDINIENIYFPFDSQLYGLFWEQVILPIVVQRSSNDLLFCPTMNAPIREIKMPVIVQVHDIFRYIGDVSRLDKLRQRIRLPLMLSHADSIVTVSEFTKSEIIDNFRISPSKIEVIYNGVDPIFLDDTESEPIDLPDEYLLYVGGTNARKNISSILKCFELLKEEYGLEQDLVMVGPEPKKHHIYPNVDLNGDDIYVMGYLSKRELKYVYENSSVFLFPSLYEGFGMAPLEAMACQTPVVASNRASLPEILGDGALQVDPHDPLAMADKVHQVINDANKREELLRIGEKRANQYTWERSAQKLMNICQKVIDESN